MVVVVTGAGKGIGAAVVLELLRLKHHVVRISRTLPGLPAHQGFLTDIKMDLLEEGAAASIRSTLADKNLRPSILINNAGVLVNKPFAQLTSDEELKMMQLNVLLPAQLIRALMGLLEKPAHIVNIGSMGGVQGSSKFPDLSMYSASKAALACLTECLAEELKDKQISVNCLALGSVQTEMLTQAFPGYQAPVSPSQIAQYIVDFALNQSLLFNGKIIPVSVNTP